MKMLYTLYNSLLLGTSLTKEVEYELYHYVAPIDPSLYQFEVTVDKKHGNMCFTHDIAELDKAYNLGARCLKQGALTKLITWR